MASRPHQQRLAAFRAWALTDANPQSDWIIERADARNLFEQLEAAHTALKMWVEMVEESDLIQIKPSYEPFRAALHETDHVLGSNPASVDSVEQHTITREEEDRVVKAALERETSSPASRSSDG